jgi:hypothetical protein
VDSDPPDEDDLDERVIVREDSILCEATEIVSWYVYCDKPGGVVMVHS